MHVLIVEDDEELAAAISHALAAEGHTIQAVVTGEEAEDLAADDAHDLYILDVMLPDCNGFNLCKNIRHMGIAAPVLMLTALATTSNKVDGLDAGADDYLTKPFEYKELIARVRALLRRGTASTAEVLTFLDVELNLSERTVGRGGKTVSLSGKQFALLEYFMKNPNEVLSRSAIMQSVWNAEYEQGSNLVDIQVSALRKKLVTASGPSLIHTVVGSGYRFGMPIG
jgi:DNA-binding response OmpR family regulator